jgi:hypothetical protein
MIGVHCSGYACSNIEEAFLHAYIMGIFSISQVPGVPIMYITRHRYSIERLPEATIGGGM